MNLPTITNYGRGDKGHVITCGELTVWFSYATPVAFQLREEPVVIRQNDWSTTTGNHLNAIYGGDKASRIPGDEFERQLKEACK